ncbi:hypothetical protein [Lysobacter fragariae]
MADIQKRWLDFIASVATDQNWKVDQSKTRLRIYDDNYHATAFLVKANRVGYLQVHAWETSHPKKDLYGRAIYSIRKETDVVEFCNILIASNSIRAMRRGEP